MGPEWFGVQVAQSWAEAVAAIGTTAAFVVAAVVYATQQRDRRDDEAKQARLVFRTRETWAVMYNEDGKLDEHRYIRFGIVNDSDRPIHSVGTTGIWSDGNWNRPQLQFLTAASEQISPGLPETLYEAEFPITYEIDINRWDVEIEFVDADGRLWRRRGMDQPRRVTKRARPRLRRRLSARARP